MRLQRYLQQVVQCNIQPVVILNKADLVTNPETYRQAVQELGYNCPVIFTSAVNHTQQEEWTNQYLLPRHTYILLGSSGVGKSTLPEPVHRSYLKLLREQCHFQASEADRRRDEKQFTKMAKQVFRHRKDSKY